MPFFWIPFLSFLISFSNLSPLLCFLCIFFSPLSLLLPTIFSQWQLSFDSFLHFHFSPPQWENGQATGALFKQTGGRVVRRGWRHAITNHWLLAVSGTRRTWPRYGKLGSSGTCRADFHDNQTATLATARCRVMADGSWCINPPGRMVWRVWDGITTIKVFKK